MSDPALLDEADKAFVAAMAAIDAESDAAIKGRMEELDTLSDAFLAKVTEQLQQPVKIEDDGAGTTP